MKIYFATHATSLDNELEISSGWHDVGLSDLGKKQAAELKQHFWNIKIEQIFCSDLKRAYETAQIAFGDTHKIIRDQRLRELNYGDYNGKPTAIVGPLQKQHFETPFPNGESYEQAEQRMHQFLQEIKEKYPEQTILIIGHRATHYGLDTFTGRRTLEEGVNEKFIWQPYWKYEL